MRVDREEVVAANQDCDTPTKFMYQSIDLYPLLLMLPMSGFSADCVDGSIRQVLGALS